MSWNIIQFLHTIKFHSYDHDNTSVIERINNFRFSCHRSVLNHVWKYWKSSHNYGIGVKLDGEDGHVKKKEKKVCLDETMVKKPSTYKCIPKYISGTTLER